MRSTATYRLSVDQELDWPTFKLAESLLLDLLNQYEMPLHQRLRLGIRALASLQADEAVDLDKYIDSPPVTIDAPLREQIGGLLDNIMAWDRLALSGLPRNTPRDLRHAELSDAARLATILRAMHFSKTYAYEYDLITAHNFAVILYLLALS